MRRSPWILLLLVGACASLQHPDQRPRSEATLEQVRTAKNGVCASITDLGSQPWSTNKKFEQKTTVGDKLLSSAVEACARVQPGGAGPGEGAVLDVALIFPQQDERWRPEFWHLEIIRGNGMVVQAGSLDGRVEEGVCVLDVCNKEGHATVVLSEPWEADRYRIRLRHVPTRKSVELAITLN